MQYIGSANIHKFHQTLSIAISSSFSATNYPNSHDATIPVSPSWHRKPTMHHHMIQQFPYLHLGRTPPHIHIYPHQSECKIQVLTLLFTRYVPIIYFFICGISRLGKSRCTATWYNNSCIPNLAYALAANRNPSPYTPSSVSIQNRKYCLSRSSEGLESSSAPSEGAVPVDDEWVLLALSSMGSSPSWRNRWATSWQIPSSTLRGRGSVNGKFGWSLIHACVASVFDCLGIDIRRSRVLFVSHRNIVIMSVQSTHHI